MPLVFSFGNQFWSLIQVTYNFQIHSPEQLFEKMHVIYWTDTRNFCALDMSLPYETSHKRKDKVN